MGDKFIFSRRIKFIYCYSCLPDKLSNQAGAEFTMLEMGFYDMSLTEKGRYSLTQSTRLKSMSFDAREVSLYSSITFSVSVSLDRKPYFGLKTWLSSIRPAVTGIISILSLDIFP